MRSAAVPSRSASARRPQGDQRERRGRTLTSPSMDSAVRRVTVASTHHGLVVGPLAGTAGIMSIPTLMIFREGVLVFSQPGALPPAALEDLIAQGRALDMGEIHRAVAAQDAVDARLPVLASWRSDVVLSSLAGSLSTRGQPRAESAHYRHRRCLWHRLHARGHRPHP